MSVMPLDVPGHTCTTLIEPVSLSLPVAGAVNEAQSCWGYTIAIIGEFLVSANHQFALIMSLPFVHASRRYY